jgi:hypothetical protein
LPLLAIAESSGEAGDVGWGPVGQPLLPPLDDAGGDVSKVEVNRWEAPSPRLCNKGGGDGTVNGTDGSGKDDDDDVT